MNRRVLQLVFVAALVAIAGCAGGMGGQPANESATDDPSATDDSSDGGAGTAAFYVSDEPNAIDDFEHLNVTITKVGFKKTGESSDADTEPDGDTDDANETDGDADTEPDADAEPDDERKEQTDGDGETDEKGTEGDGDDEKDGDEENAAEGEKDGDEADGEAGSEWVEYDVDERTVDLTELKGANASMIDEFELPAGDYETVFIYVSDTEGVLNDGSTTRVKLPSSKLQLNTKFTVGNGERVDFVYDIAPHKAGKSGKYILKPVISESGTGDDVEIRDVDTDDEKEGKEKRGNGGGNGKNGADAAEANAADD